MSRVRSALTSKFRSALPKLLALFWIRHRLGARCGMVLRRLLGGTLRLALGRRQQVHLVGAHGRMECTLRAHCPLVLDWTWMACVRLCVWLSRLERERVRFGLRKRVLAQRLVVVQQGELF